MLSQRTSNTSNKKNLQPTRSNQQRASTLTPLTALTMILNEKGIPYLLTNQNQTYSSEASIQISLNNKSYTFTDDHLPSRGSSHTDELNDPEHRYQLLNQRIQMPKTMGFIGPNGTSSSFPVNNHLPSLISVIEKFFSYPVLIKIHSSKDKDPIQTFFCKDQKAILLPLQWIAQHDIQEATLVAEAYILSTKKYQVFCYDHSVILAYEWPGSPQSHPKLRTQPSATQTLNLAKLTQLQKRVQPLLQHLEAMFTQLEFVEDKYGDLYLTNVKTNPSIKSLIKNYINKNSPNRNDANNNLLILYRSVLDRLLTATVSA